MKPTMTRHALVRSKERIGLGRKAAERLAGIALVKGLTIDELRGDLKHSAELMLKTGQCNDLRIYAEKIFLFAGTTLVTVLPLHNESKAQVRKLMRAKERKN
jgi:hypothetical protein